MLDTRRGFFKKATALLAAVAVARVPNLPSAEVAVPMAVPQEEEEQGFTVFGRCTQYAKPSARCLNYVNGFKD